MSAGCRQSSQSAIAKSTRLARNRPLADVSNAGRKLKPEEQRDHAGGDHRDGRERVEDVLDRERGAGRRQRYAIADERRLRGLPDERTEWGDVADRVAADDRGKRVGDAKPIWRFKAQPPCERANQKSQTADRDDRDEPPADLTKVRLDLRKADLPDDPHEQCESSQDGQDACPTEPAHISVRSLAR